MTTLGVNFYDMFTAQIQTMTGTRNTTVTNPLLQRKSPAEVTPAKTETFNASYTNTAKKNTLKFAKLMATDNVFKGKPEGKSSTYAAKLKELLLEFVVNEAPRLSEKDFAEIQRIANNYAGSGEISDSDAKKIKTILEKEEYWGQTAAEMQEQAEAEIEKAEQEAEEKTEQVKTDSLNPKYNKDHIIEEAGYTTTQKVHSDMFYDNDTCHENSKKFVQEKVTEVLDKLEAAMIAQLGDKATPEVKASIKNAKIAIKKETADGYYAGISHIEEFGKGKLFYDYGKYGIVNIEGLITKFFEKYDEFAKNSVEQYKKSQE